MKKKTITLTVSITFSDDGIQDEQTVINSVADALLHQANHAGIVGDDEESYTETIDVRNEQGNGITLDVATGKTI